MWKIVLDNKKRGLIIISIGILLIVGSFIYSFVATDLFKDKNNNQSNNTQTTTNNVKTTNYDGVYELEDKYIKVLKKVETDSNEEKLLIKINDRYNGTLEKKGNKWEEAWNEYIIEFEFNENELTVTYNRETLESYDYFKNGTYKKTKEYTAKEYFEDNIGDSKLFNSKYNGIYELNERIIYLYQSREDTVTIYKKGKSKNAHGNVITNRTGYKIDNQNDNKLSKNENEYVIFNGHTIELYSNELKDFVGTYSKKEELTFEKVVSIY